MTAPQTVPKGWRLIGKNGTMNGKIFSLEITNISIGTDPTVCNIVYSAGTLGIAQLHCKLIWEDNRWLVISFGDSGTWLNDNLLKNGQAVPLNSGDTLSLANSGNNFILEHNIVLTPQDRPETNQSKNDDSSGKSSEEHSTSSAPEKNTWTKLKEKFFSYNGRLNREPYILRITAVTLVYIADLTALLYIDTIPTRELTDFGFFLGIVLLIALIILAGSIFCLAIRRLHDLDKSGWWVLLSFVPIINFVLGLYLMFKKGMEGNNRFGSDPLA